MPSKFPKGKVSRSEFLFHLISIHAGASHDVIFRVYKLTTNDITLLDVCSKQWKRIKAELLLHLVALSEAGEQLR